MSSGPPSTRCSAPRGRAGSGASAGRRSTATSPETGTRSERCGTCCCRPSGRSSPAPGGSRPAGMNYVCQRLDVAPADAYGVATFYAMFSVSPQPPSIAHVCDDIACRLAGAREIAAELESRLGPGGRRLAALAVPRPLRARSRGAVPALRSRRAGLGRRSLRRRGGRRRPRREHRPGSRFSILDVLRLPVGAADAGLPPRASPPPVAGRPRRPDEPRRLSRRRRIPGAPRRVRAGTGRRPARNARVEADGSRRRRLPRGPQVGGRRAADRLNRTTSCATPTSRSPARSRTASSWRRIRSRSSSR